MGGGVRRNRALEEWGLSDEASGFVPTVEEVEALDGLTGGTFDEVVFCAEDEDASGPWVEAEGDVAEVCAQAWAI